MDKKEKVKVKGPWKFADYYEEHGAELNKKKKKKYRDDPKYRESLKERVRDQHRKENGILENGSRIAKSGRVRFVGWKLGDAANILGINSNTLRGYFHNGHLPHMDFEDTRLRLVTVDQIPLIYEFLARVNKVGLAEAAKQFGPTLKQHWRDRDGSKEIIN